MMGQNARYKLSLVTRFNPMRQHEKLKRVFFIYIMTLFCYQLPASRDSNKLLPRHLSWYN